MFLSEDRKIFGLGDYDESAEIAAVLESEMQWNNLMEKMFRCEHYAIVNEDSALLENAITEWFNKAKELFEKFINSIKDFIVRAYNWIRDRLINGKRLIEENKDILSKIKTKDLKGIKVRTYTYKTESTSANSMVKKVMGNSSFKFSRIMAATEKETYSTAKLGEKAISLLGGKDDAAYPLATNLRNAFYNNNERDLETATLTPSMVGDAVSRITSLWNYPTTLRNEYNIHRKTVNEAIQLCEKGAREAKQDSAEQKKFKAQVEAAKNVLNVTRTVNSVQIAVVNEIIQQSTAHVRAALTAYRRPAKKK